VLQAFDYLSVKEPPDLIEYEKVMFRGEFRFPRVNLVATARNRCQFLVTPAVENGAAK